MKMESSESGCRQRIAVWLLRAAIVLFALGLALGLFTRVGSSLGSIALMHWNVPHSAILLAEKIGATVVLAAALSLLIRPTMLGLLAVAIPVFVEAVAAVKAGGTHFFELTPYAHALRYMTPLALIPLIANARFFGTLETRCAISSWLLRVATATVFVIHGYEAWKLHPYFIDFVITAAYRVLELDLNEANAARILKIIAVADLIASICLLLKLSWPLLWWLAFWGLATALARPVTLGLLSYPEVLLRASHVLAPLAIGFLILKGKSVRMSEPSPR